MSRCQCSTQFNYEPRQGLHRSAPPMRFVEPRGMMQSCNVWRRPRHTISVLTCATLHLLARLHRGRDMLVQIVFVSCIQLCIRIEHVPHQSTRCLQHFAATAATNTATKRRLTTHSGMTMWQQNNGCKLYTTINKGPKLALNEMNHQEKPSCNHPALACWMRVCHLRQSLIHGITLDLSSCLLDSTPYGGHATSSYLYGLAATDDCYAQNTRPVWYHLITSCG